MSAAKTIQEDYKRITCLLEQQRLKEVHKQLETFQQLCDDWSLHNRLEQVSTSYSYMLTYMRQGMADPERDRIFHRLLTETWEIADQTCLALLDKFSTHYYHILRRTQGLQFKSYNLTEILKKLEVFPDEVAICQLMPDAQGLDEVLKRHEESLQQLFLSTWCNSNWSAEELEQANKFKESEQLSTNDLCLMVSAVTLSLMECLDARKFLWLQTVTTHNNVQVNQRAFVGLALVMLTHPLCFDRYPDLLQNFHLLNEDGHFVKLLNRVTLGLLRAKETEKVNKKMREEILPQVAKNANIFLNLRKMGLEENGDEDDRNPDWEKAFEESGLDEKIREMGELQMQGADVYMSTFAQLKHYPFFKEIQNWFYPYEEMHSEVVKTLHPPAGKNHLLATIILRSGFFCNSDKYSLTFMMSQLPETQRNMMLNQLTSQGMDEWADESKYSTLREHAERPDVVSTQYIHDLYRFFKLSARRQEFPDVFKGEIDLRKVGNLKEFVCSDPEGIRSIADYLFQQGHYPQAESFYREVEPQASQRNVDLYQKIGYCHQQTGLYADAITAYLTADVLKPDHLWTIRHLATCYRRTDDFHAALEYYQRAEAMQPENPNLLLQIGSCLVKLKLYDEALQYLFKLDFLKENNLKAWRAIGWCSFISGKHEQAMRYYEKLVATEKPLVDDYLNAGHVAWRLGDVPQAVSYYREATLLCEGNQGFYELFMEDEEELIRQGFSKEDIRLMIDMAIS